MRKIIHIIQGLDTGGAEMMLYKVLKHMDNSTVSNHVVSLIGEGSLSKPIRDLGISITTCGFSRKGQFNAKALMKLLSIVRKEKPDIIQGWLYHGNLAATVARLAAPRSTLYWNVRHTVYRLQDEKPRTAQLIKLSAFLSFLPNKILYNSYTGAESHGRLGFSKSKQMIIPNGFDCDIYSPNSEYYLDVRNELGELKDTRLVGLIGRFHPHKDQHTFVKAASRILQRQSNVKFLLAGRGNDVENRELVSWLKQYEVEPYFHLLGERNDVARIMAALDIAVCSSITESFPNVIGEAMSSGVPCVTTDVGDARRIVGHTGKVVPPSADADIAKAVAELLSWDKHQLHDVGQTARIEIIQRFSMDAIAQLYEQLYIE